MAGKVKVNIIGTGDVLADSGATLRELSGLRRGCLPALAATVDSVLCDLSRKILYDCRVEFLDITTAQGFRTYQKGMSLLLVYAAKSVLGRKTRLVIEHSINKNYYCEMPELGRPVTDGMLAAIEDFMRETVARDLPIERHALPRETAVRYLEEHGFDDKIRLLKYKYNATFSFYKLDWCYNYFYGEMAPSTGVLSQFKLTKRGGGFMLHFPDTLQNLKYSETVPDEKLFEVFSESNRWMKIMKADNVGSLNDIICASGSGEIIRVAEALHEKKIAQLADQIMAQGKRVVLIAGPSSSGKTTFAARLAVQLKVNGAHPRVVSLDNYYVNREDYPLDEHGKADLETIEAIDTRQLREDLRGLLAGEKVEIPSYDFHNARREMRGNCLQMDGDSVLILEGIHGLNEQVSRDAPKKDVFRIFISALTQINIDDHNRIPTTDARLLRRIVRDSLFRGASAAKTFDMWPSVLRGEIRHIFPYQETADAFFNSALVYEMCVLKQYAEPLLYAIAPDQPQYTEARRLIRFLSSFLGVPSETVPPNSILREFLGGGCFHH